ncbi:MAG: hypothetical protein ABI818_04965, partial [Acidobacteriota bacterium]
MSPPRPPIAASSLRLMLALGAACVVVSTIAVLTVTRAGDIAARHAPAPMSTPRPGATPALGAAVVQVNQSTRDPL